MRGTQAQTCAAGGTALRLKGMWPYWLHEDEGRVKNDIVLEDSMAVLSGPNMGGKSTALRSITAAALLANAGLPIPAAPGSQVPQVLLFEYPPHEFFRTGICCSSC